MLTALYNWAFAQDIEKSTLLENQLTTMVQQQDSLTIYINSNVAQTDSLAHHIFLLREKQNLNFVERNQLDRLLKQSLDLSTGQETSVTAYKNLSKDINDLKSTLLKRYSDQEKELMVLLRKNPGNTQLSIDLSSVRTKKTNLEQINRPLQSINISDVYLQIEKTDMPRDIDAKAIFFRDREDTFRQKAKQLEERYKRVKEETTLRNRLAEMVDDVRLFDSRDEAVSQSTSSNVTAETSKDNTFSNDRAAWINPEEMGGISNTLNVFNANELLGLDFQNMPSYDVMDYLIGLEKQKAVLLREADSLSTLADTFEKEANKLRSTLKNAH